jgi:hypothetical protein
VAAPRTRTTLDLATALVALAVVLVGTARTVHLSLTIGTVVGVALAPLWLGALRRYRGAPVFAALCCALPVAGWWLTESASAVHRTSSQLLLSTVLVILNVLVAVGILLWARLRMRTETVAVLLGLGMVLGIGREGRFAENPWRFGLAIPLTVLLLALAWRSGRRWLEVVLALVLALVTALSGGRSTFALLLVAGAVVAWQATAQVVTGKAASRTRVVLLVGVLGFAVYQVGQGLILDGYLGESAQERTAAQIQQSGSVLLGGRPELGATLALVARQPTGFGAGTLPSVQDVATAKTGMARLGYDPNNGYVENYMFGNAFEVHSILGDAWMLYGLTGVVFVAVTLWMVLSAVVEQIARRAAPALLVFLALWLVWNTLFSPLYSSSPYLAATVGLALALRAPRGEAAAVPETRPRT